MSGREAEQIIRSGRPTASRSMPPLPSAAAFRVLGSVALATFVAACGGGNSAAPGEPESLQAVLSIERHEHASSGETPSASAMAEFVVLPADADAHDTLDAAGLRSQLPGRSACVESLLGDVRALDSAQPRASSSPFPEQLELLEAGDVSIDADGMVTLLALNLFPPSGSASGVIYTTPDQSATPLPADTRYAISATGSEAIPPFSIRGDAPRSLRDVTLSGVPLERVTSLVPGQPVDFTWAEGDAADVVYVEMADADSSVLCGFADADGSGTVPSSFTSKLAPDSIVRVSVHRVREALSSHELPRIDAMPLETMVRFDFEITSLLRVE